MSGKPVHKDILKSVKLDAIEDNSKVEENSKIEDDVTRVYKDKNYRVKKELSFKTKKNNSKLA
ncbi:hypothetical protein [Cellulophaga fucicola]|uniref:Uncharacterized protein n=1 Tax=Cellulophaga fucicola TaxID=76595 RepID=A0A1K1QN40_9FLAO|nr:hypothetical protein [Cellulophaga fucicola]SFW61116.1 hypothetical protein SAMN05660313_02804 [Cellulophaga fucicola]